MTRGKWVALAVGLAVAACLVAIAPQAWLWSAYRNAEVEEIVRFPISGFPKWLKEVRRPALVKRWDWLPGREVVLPDRRCNACLHDSHRNCPRRISISEVADELLCTCRHPSHAQDSK